MTIIPSPSGIYTLSGSFTSGLYSVNGTFSSGSNTSFISNFKNGSSFSGSVTSGSLFVGVLSAGSILSASVISGSIFSGVFQKSDGNIISFVGPITASFLSGSFLSSSYLSSSFNRNSYISGTFLGSSVDLNAVFVNTAYFTGSYISGTVLINNGLYSEVHAHSCPYLNALNFGNDYSMSIVDIISCSNFMSISLANDFNISQLTMSMNPSLKYLDLSYTFITASKLSSFLVNFYSESISQNVTSGSLNLTGSSTSSLTSDGRSAISGLVNLQKWTVTMLGT